MHQGMKTQTKSSKKIRPPTTLPTMMPMVCSVVRELESVARTVVMFVADGVVVVHATVDVGV